MPTISRILKFATPDVLMEQHLLVESATADPDGKEGAVVKVDTDMNLIISTIINKSLMPRKHSI